MNFLPRPAEGRQLLAHELTHVVQQSGGATTVQRQPNPQADQEREAAIERARIRRVLHERAGQDASGRRTDVASKAGKSDDKNYAVSLGWKDRALIQNKQAVSPQLFLWEIATKTRFFSGGKAKATYWHWSAML